MTGPELHIDQQWRAKLAAAELDSFDTLMESSRGRCASWHTRGQVYRIELDDGPVVYLKRDTFTLTMLKDALADLLRLRRPEPPCIKEVAALKAVAELGIATPGVIAWGQRRRWGLPFQAVLVMTELPGEPLSKLAIAKSAPDQLHQALRAVGRTVGILHEAGLRWPDMAPKHFFIAGDQAGVLDLARMPATPRPGRGLAVKHVKRFCRRLRKRGGDDRDIEVFLNAAGLDELLV